MAHIFVAGASRRVGFETVRLLREQDHDVTCFFRAEADREKVEATGAQAIIVDAFDAAAVDNAVAGAGQIDAIVCTLGGKPGDEPRIDFTGAKHCVDAATARRIQRFLFVTAIGCGDTWDVLEEKAKQFLGAAVTAKNQAEEYLVASGLDYTILRPGGLTDDAASGNAFLTHSNKVLGMISRADVAAQLVRCLASDATRKQTYQVLDRNQVRTTAPYEEASV